MMAVTDEKFDYPRFAMAQNVMKTAHKNATDCNYLKIYFIQTMRLTVFDRDGANCLIYTLFCSTTERSNNYQLQLI